MKVSRRFGETYLHLQGKEASVEERLDHVEVNISLLVIR
jgi:hypothetical protein